MMLDTPDYAYTQPIEIVLPEKRKGKIFLSGTGWTNDLPLDCVNNGYTHIINCAGKIAREQSYKTNVEQLQLNYDEIELEDIPEENLEIWAKNIYNKIDVYLESNSKILIHCQWGKSRSVSILIYYLMKKYKWNYNKTIDYVRKYRTIAEPNIGYETFLKSLEF